MSLEKIVQEAIEGRPLEMKEAFEEAIQEKVVAALEAKYMEMAGLVDEELEEAKDEDDDEDDDDDEDEDDDDDEDDMDESFDLSDYSVEEIEAFMQTEEFEQLDEISKTKMGQYIKRAADDKETQKKRAAIFDKKGIDADKDKDMYNAFGKADKARKKADNRSKFIGKAVDRLTK